VARPPNPARKRTTQHNTVPTFFGSHFFFFASRRFFPAVAHLSTARVPLAVLANAGLAGVLLTYKLVTKVRGREGVWWMAVKECAL
jgi:hypothetical protein